MLRAEGSASMNSGMPEGYPGRGRPSKLLLDPTIQDRMVEAIKLGATYEHACQYAGISYTPTFLSWMKRGFNDLNEEADSIYADFYKAVRKAGGDATIGWLKKIEAAADGGVWQAAAWKLERRYPHIYGRVVQTVEQLSLDAQSQNEIPLEDLVAALQVALRDKGIEIEIDTEDVARAYLRQRVGAKRLGLEARSAETTEE